MNKIILSAATLVVLFLAGCGQNAPELKEGSRNNIYDASALTGDAVTINENSYSSGGLGNSSSDGFQSIFFGFGDYGISASMENNIARNVRVASATSSKIKIEGNCDEFGTDEYNYALGLKRAKAVKDVLVSNGVRSSQMVIVSYGESNPICTTGTDSCYAKNRRVDLRLVR